MRPLTAKEQKFVEGVLAGKTNADAYREAYPSDKGDNGGIAERAWRVSKRPAVQAALAKINAKVEEKLVITKERLLRPMLKIVERDADREPQKIVGEDGDEQLVLERDPRAVPAAALISKIMGYDAPEKIELNVEGSLLFQIRNRVRSRRPQ
jgi:phage terminase small subunit